MKLPNEVKITLMSSLPLLAAIILFIIAGNIGFSQISNIRDQIDQATKDQNVLQQKVTLLNSVAANAGTQSNAASLALPDSNTTLAALSQLKNLATSNTTVISNIRASGEAKDSSGLSRVDISFDLEGTLDQVTNFMKSVKTVAPVMNVGSVKISGSGDTTKASLLTSTYWSALPTTLPSTNQVEQSLTPDEENTLATLQSLTPPTIIGITPQATGGRPNPFSP